MNKQKQEINNKKQNLLKSENQSFKNKIESGNKIRNINNNKNSSTKNSVGNKNLINSNSKKIITNLNENENFKNFDDDKIPLIEKIITIGIKPTDLLNFEKKNKNTFHDLINLKFYDIINESFSINIKINCNDYPNKENLLLYVFNKSFHCPKIVYDEIDSYEYEIFSFTTYNNLKRKHYSCLKYYEKYYFRDKIVYCQNAILFISNFPIYNTMQSFQTKIINIYLNNRKYNTKPEKLEYVILKISRINTSKISEVKFIPLYLNILLNSIYHINPYINDNKAKRYSNNYLPLFKDEIEEPITQKVYGSCCRCNKIGLNFLESKNICLVILNSNEIKNRIFLKYNTSIIKDNFISNSDNSNQEKKILCEKLFYQPITIPDINISDLLFKYFSSSNLILIYLFLLTEQKIFLIFENLKEINLIIFSLLCLLSPLKWDLPIISFITENQTDLFETPFSLIAGIPNELKDSLILILKKTGDDCVVYDLKEKIFLKTPRELDFKQIDKKYFAELKSELENIKSLSFKFEIDLDEQIKEFQKIFPNLELNYCKNIDFKLYLNLHIMITFYKFLNKFIFGNFIQSLKIDKIFELKKIDKTKENLNVFNYFDINIFSKNEDKNINNILYMIGRSMIITQFIYNFIIDNNINLKIDSINNEEIEFCDEFNSIYESFYYFLKMNTNLKNNYLIYIIKKRIIEYYKFSFFSIDQLLKITYMDKENHKILDSGQKEILLLTNLDSILNHSVFPICKYKIPLNINDFYLNENQNKESISKLSMNFNSNSYCHTEEPLSYRNDTKYNNNKETFANSDYNNSHLSLISEDIKKLNNLYFLNLFNILSKFLFKEKDIINDSLFESAINENEINNRNIIKNNEPLIKNSLKLNKLNSNKIFSRNIKEDNIIPYCKSEIDFTNKSGFNDKNDLLKENNFIENSINSRNNNDYLSKSFKNINLDLSSLIENHNKTSINSQDNFKTKVLRKNSKRIIHNQILDIVNKDENIKKFCSSQLKIEQNLTLVNKKKSNLEIMIGDNDCDFDWND